MQQLLSLHVQTQLICEYILTKLNVHQKQLIIIMDECDIGLFIGAAVVESFFLYTAVDKVLHFSNSRIVLAVHYI